MTPLLGASHFFSNIILSLYIPFKYLRFSVIMPLDNTGEFTFYDNSVNSENKLKPFYHTDLKSTLENIVFKEKPEKEKSIIDKIFSDKSKTLKTTVKSLLNEIELR